MIFISAGHNSQSKSIKQDPGAVNKFGVKEGDLTIEFRGLVIAELVKLGATFTPDSDEETLAMYLRRIQTGSGSVVVEYHFDAAESELATGATVLVGVDSDRLDKAMAKELLESTTNLLGIKNRGVLSEADSHRGKLGLMREQGTVALVELCFITNPKDLEQYHRMKYLLATSHAYILLKYEKLIS